MAAEERDMNPDPITGEPGAHPVGTGVGATGGAVAGATMGVIGGPIGVAVGGVIGAVVGGLAGKAAAEAVNPTAEAAHWRENYDKEPYYESGKSFDDYAPAYEHGLSGRTRYEDDWDTAEPRLASDWESSRGSSSLDWQKAKPASRAAWDRAGMLQAGSGIGGGSGAAMGTGAGMRSGSGDSGSYASSSGADTFGSGSKGSGASTGAGYGDSAGSGSTTGSTGNSMSSDKGSMSMTSGDSSMSMGSGGNSMSMGSGSGSGSGGTVSGSTGTRGTAAMVGEAQSAGDNSGDRDDVVDVLQDLVECCKDGEYGFQACAEQADRQDLKSLFLQRADDCRRGAQELNQHIRSLGGDAEDSGSAAGAMHRGWVSVKATFTSYDDLAVLEEAERGEDNALARYRKAQKKNLSGDVKRTVDNQMHGVQRNHDQIKMLRNQFRNAS